MCWLCLQCNQQKLQTAPFSSAVNGPQQKSEVLQSITLLASLVCLFAGSSSASIASDFSDSPLLQEAVSMPDKHTTQVVETEQLHYTSSQHRSNTCAMGSDSLGLPLGLEAPVMTPKGDIFLSFSF